MKLIFLLKKFQMRWLTLLKSTRYVSIETLHYNCLEPMKVVLKRILSNTLVHLHVPRYYVKSSDAKAYIYIKDN